MPKHSKSSRRRSRAEIAEILRDLKRSGLTQKEFSRSRRVAVSTLQSWLSQARKERRSEAHPSAGASSADRQLIAVSMIGDGSRPEATGQPSIYEITLLGGTILRVPFAFEERSLQKLLTLLVSC